MRREYFLFFLSPLLLVVVGVGALQVVTGGARRDLSRSAGDLLMGEVKSLIQREYVTPTTDMDLSYGAAEGMTARLDRYCGVFRPSAWQHQQQDDEGLYDGIGIRSYRLAGRAVVVQVIRGGPADLAGLRAGDALVALNGVAVARPADMALVARGLRGPRGSTLKLQLEDWDGQHVRELSVVRGVASSETAYGVQLPQHQDVGYVRLTGFNGNTSLQFDRAVGGLLAAGIKALVLDVRGNRGGLLSVAVYLADRFLRSGPIVTTLGRHQKKVYEAHNVREDLDLPLVILVDKGSASASQVLVGALQDHGRAAIVGERTFGKGVVQAEYAFRYAPGGIKLTTAHYVTPAGRCIEKALALGAGGKRRGGLQPDVLVPLSRSQRSSAREQVEWLRFQPFIRAALKREQAGRSRELSDPQLQAALGLLAGRSRDVSLQVPRD